MLLEALERLSEVLEILQKRKITLLELATLVSKETGIKRSCAHEVLNTAFILINDFGLEIVEKNDDED